MIKIKQIGIIEQNNEQNNKKNPKLKRIRIYKNPQK